MRLSSYFKLKAQDESQIVNHASGETCKVWVQLNSPACHCRMCFSSVRWSHSETTRTSNTAMSVSIRHNNLLSVKMNPPTCLVFDFSVEGFSLDSAEFPAFTFSCSTQYSISERKAHYRCRPSEAMLLPEMKRRRDSRVWILLHPNQGHKANL